MDNENVTREDAIRYISNYALQENVSIEESDFIAKFCGELLDIFDDNK